MDADGANQSRLTNSPASGYGPSWSPNGTRIVFTSHRSGGAQIYVMGADGSAQRQLTMGPEENYSPAWSPDGRRVAYASTADLTTSGVRSICVMNADGSHRQRIATGDAPRWSPDGNWVVFSGIYLTRPDGTGLARLTTGPPLDWLPAWAR